MWGATIFLLLLGLACNLERVPIAREPDPTIAAVLAPTPTLQLPEPTPPGAIPDSGWQLLQPGLERRVLNLTTAENEGRESLYILRIDPALFRFDVAYHPGQPQSLEQWQAETGAFLVVNGGFFTEDYSATGAIVVDGQSSGVGYRDFGGMLAISPGGPTLRWLPQQPYSPNEPLLAGLQSFPMLILPGGQPGYPDEDNQPARRTVIAQDINGRMLFVLAVTGAFSLHRMGRFLAESDLNIDRALNLDGGTSTGLLLADPPEGIAAYSLLPAVIIIHPINQ